MYAYAYTVGTMFVGCKMFNVLSAWGNKQSHKCIRNVLSSSASIAQKWSLNVSIAFSATFCQSMISGTVSYIMPLLLIACKYSLRLHCWGCVIPLLCPRRSIGAINLLYAWQILPDELVFIDLTRIRFPSFSYRTNINMLPWLETTRSLLVWSMYMMFLMLSVVTLSFLHACCGLWMICVSKIFSFTA